MNTGMLKIRVSVMEFGKFKVMRRDGSVAEKDYEPPQSL